MEYKYKQIKNFLDQDTFNKIKEIILSNTFPWFFNESQTSGKNDSFFMGHNFYHDHQKNSIYYDTIITPIIKKLKVNMINEIRANLLFKTKKHTQSEFHVDKEFFCNTAIFYINKNNGYTLLKDKTKISEWSSNDMKGSFSESGIRNIWINPTDSYLIINNKLRVTNHHLIHFKRNNVYYFNFAESLEIHDELLTDEGVYEPVELIEFKKDTINVYNFELDKDQTYFADNYLVHHYCKLCSGYSNII